jgi:hypothetical protein
VAALAVIAGSTSMAQDDKHCLDQVYAKYDRNSAEAVFDKRYDRVNASDASFSCYLFIPASRARNAIESFRYGVIYQDRRSLDRAVRYPLTVILNGATGGSHKREKLTVHDYEEWMKIGQSEMTRAQKDVIRCSWLGSVSLVGGHSFNPGFIINDGLVFFSTSSAQDVRVTSVDLLPITDEMLKRACIGSIENEHLVK